MITRRDFYRLKGGGHHARGFLTKKEAERELIAAEVDYTIVTRRERGDYGKTVYRPYCVFPLAELFAWEEKGALDRAWIRVLHGEVIWTVDQFIAELAKRRLRGETCDL